jgi:hypothetical protein
MVAACRPNLTGGCGLPGARHTGPLTADRHATLQPSNSKHVTSYASQLSYGQALW